MVRRQSNRSGGRFLHSGRYTAFEHGRQWPVMVLNDGNMVHTQLNRIYFWGFASESGFSWVWRLIPSPMAEWLWRGITLWLYQKYLSAVRQTIHINTCVCIWLTAGHLPVLGIVAVGSGLALIVFGISSFLIYRWVLLLLYGHSPWKHVWCDKSVQQETRCIGRLRLTAR